MKLNYETELEEHDLSVNDLPAEKKTGIKQINQIKRAISMLEKKGKSPSEETLNKIKAMDKWVTYEIYDLLNETDDNEEEIPFEADEVVEDIQEQIEESNKTNEVENTPVEIDPKGLEIEIELKQLFDVGKTKFDIEELQSNAPISYDLLFDTYEPDEQNGIETSQFKLMEKTDGLFYISKQ